MPSMPVNLENRTYHALGWTISSTSANTRFSNDSTGHGMFVNIANVELF
jgi:hypothetical protein